MPHKSGISHMIAGILALLISPLVKDLISVLVSTQDLMKMIRSVGTTIAQYQNNPFTADATTTVLYLITIAALTFIWGYAYHISRHT